MSVGMLDNEPLIRSSHVELRSLPARSCFAFHKLFGNAKVIDGELADYLANAQDPVSFRTLADEVGLVVADSLVDSYFFVRSSDEERNLIDKWLQERESRVDTGYFLGGLQASVSDECNFACAYCFADASDRRSRIRASIGSNRPYLRYEVVERAIQQLLAVGRTQGRKRIGVKFGGREPLLNWRVIHQLLSSFVHGEIQWAITTNGSLLTADIAQELTDRDVQVTVSLDGPAASNDRLRVLKSGGSGTYALVERGMRHLSDAAHRFGVSSVVSNATDFDAMHPFIDRLVELGARHLELTLVMQTHELRAQGTCSDEALVSNLVQLYEYGTSRGLAIHGDWVDPYHGLLTTHKFRDEDRVTRPASAGCSATSHQISLEPSGDVFPCRAMSMHYGHIDNLQSIFESDAYRRVVMRTYFNVPHCRGCELEGFCQGTCLGSLEEAGRDIYRPQEDYCRVYKLATARLLEPHCADSRLEPKAEFASV